jgi:hypothetical protein
MSTHALCDQWNADAELFDECGATEAAATLRRCAKQLAAYERERALEPLTLAESAVVSGLSISQLSRRAKNGSIENVGTASRPRLRRGDLPKKGLSKKPETPKTQTGEPDLVGRVLGNIGV